MYTESKQAGIQKIGPPGPPKGRFNIDIDPQGYAAPDTIVVTGENGQGMHTCRNIGISYRGGICFNPILVETFELIAVSVLLRFDEIGT